MVWHIVAEEMYVRGRGCCGGVVLRVKCADGGIKVADLYVIEVGYVSGAERWDCYRDCGDGRWDCMVVQK